MYFPLQNSEHDWQFRSEPSESACRSIRNGCFWPRGKMLGGTHGLNGGIYMRGNQRDFDEWQTELGASWAWSNVLGYYKKSEFNVNETLRNHQHGKWHSGSGELHVEHYHQPEAIRQVFIDAAKEFGYDFIPDHNANNGLGYANAQGTLKNGERHSTAKAFLVPAKNRKNLHVIKYGHVTKILIDAKKQVTGLEFTYKNHHKMTAKAKKEFILSTGAVSTPQLLMLNGIGPRKHLEALKIPVVEDLAVGQNLQDHLIVPIVFQFHKSSAKPENPLDLLDNLYNFAIHRKGPMAGIGTINLVGMINTVNHSGYADIELQHFNQKRQSNAFKTLLYAMDYEESVIKPLLAANEAGETNMVYVELLRPKSSGEILLKTTNPYDKPRIIPNYLHDNEDVQTLLRGIRFQIDFVKTKAFQENEGKLIRIPFGDCDQHEYMSDEYWICYMSHMATTVYHPVGTAKMGSDTDRMAVLDNAFRVRGIKGLRVIDASAFPTQVSGNTNAAVIMVAEHGADAIKNEWMKNDDKSEL